MDEEGPDEIRVRVTVDGDMPDLLQRLKASKRQAREVVHLMRLGLQMEKMLNFGAPLSISPGGGVSPSAGGEKVGVSPGAADGSLSATSVGKGTPLGPDIAAMTGLDADYFSAGLGSGESWA
jgi:hypothetical protein